jgi:hypothetical protein
MRLINFNLFSIVDILSGLLMLGTVTPLPLWFENFHAYFLISKGSLTMIKPLPLQHVYHLLILGGGADILSAILLFLGEPPIFADYKILISGFLLFKGTISLLGSF